MNQSRKLNIFSNNEMLEITYHWYHSFAFFYAAFGIAWIALLLVPLYLTRNVEEQSLSFYLIMLFFTLPGLFGLYSSLRYFLNKTYILIFDGQLTVTHKPLPKLWRNKNIHIASAKILQLYVKQVTGTNDDRQYHSYLLMAKIEANPDMELLSLPNISSQKISEVEEVLETYLNIEDRSVAEEYPLHKKDKIYKKKRMQRKDFLKSSFSPIYHAEMGSFVYYLDIELKIACILQHEWEGKNTDRLLQLIDRNGKEFLIYLKQNLSLLNAYECTSLNFEEINQFFSETQIATNNILIENFTYTIHDHKIGRQFISGFEKWLAIEEWIYKSEDSSQQILVLKIDKSYKYYKLLPLEEQCLDFADKLIDLEIIDEQQSEEKQSNSDFV